MLVLPKRPYISPNQMRGILLGSKENDPLAKGMYELYTQQGQPIVVPYGTGKVFVDPTNPCIQQYIP